MSDTPKVSEDTRAAEPGPGASLPLGLERATGSRRVRASLFAACLLAIAVPRPLFGEVLPAKATVLWTRGDRVYLAAADSGAFERGDRLTFLDRRRLVATGEVTLVHRGELVVAHVDSGSLEMVKHLERLQVLARRPALRAPALLQIGLPGSGRSNLVFTCERPEVIARSSLSAYQVRPGPDHVWRLTRPAGSATAGSQPKTLVVRLFEDPADEEIALERGELDVAMFWPGELSTRMRNDPRWVVDRSGLRSHGAIAAVEVGSSAAADSARALRTARDFAVLNRELFRGDLLPWKALPRQDPVVLDSTDEEATAIAAASVEASWPGRRVIERFLARESPAGGEPRVRLVYLEAAIVSPESLALAACRLIVGGGFALPRRAQADSLAARIESWSATDPPPSALDLRRSLRALGVHPVFAIRCPLVYAPELGRTVSDLGTLGIADLLDCAAGPP